MYKIEGEDLYLIGTSEHSMIGKFIDTLNDEEKLPYTLTSYSPCFRKEKGAMASRNVVFIVSISLKSRRWSLYVSRKIPRLGMTSCGRTPLISSAVWISRFVPWSAVPEILQI